MSKIDEIKQKYESIECRLLLNAMRIPDTIRDIYTLLKSLEKCKAALEHYKIIHDENCKTVTNGHNYYGDGKCWCGVPDEATQTLQDIWGKE